ncbi:uncharacterized protein MONBRDRAFT_24919 [Monosiga brevicollis MX1]|uniref:Proline-rich protein PRCC n=1 Tax=Monosiga brevicollis TaxID=81824 RepID=A9UY48_MONBE|nr:uncharacterized protein MONBRDRAFT_24919 [Monosiga brevicollis MX1]EDQ89798.1 predicted protein [Monosiga brevicollis MX1]|eukprot:XP_001745220.1 hypothetical protein [Monosiga brevicollis MX1]
MAALVAAYSDSDDDSGDESTQAVTAVMGAKEVAKVAQATQAAESPVAAPRRGGLGLPPPQHGGKASSASVGLRLPPPRGATASTGTDVSAKRKATVTGGVARRAKKTNISDKRKLLLAVPELEDPDSDEEDPSHKPVAADAPKARNVIDLLPAPKSGKPSGRLALDTKTIVKSDVPASQTEAPQSKPASQLVPASVLRRQRHQADASASTTSAASFLDTEEAAHDEGGFFSFGNSAPAATAKSAATTPATNPPPSAAPRATPAAPAAPVRYGYGQAHVANTAPQPQSYGYGHVTPNSAYAYGAPAAQYAAVGQQQSSMGSASEAAYHQSFAAPPTDEMADFGGVELAKLVKRDRGMGANVNIVDFNDKERREANNDWRRSVAGTKEAQAPTKTPNIAGSAKHRSQLSYLAQQAQAHQQEISNFWAAGHEARRNAKMRYGF